MLYRFSTRKNKGFFSKKKKASSYLCGLILFIPIFGLTSSICISGGPESFVPLDNSGFYVSVFGGIGYLPKTNYKITAGTSDLLALRITYKNPSRVFGVGLGYQYNAWRIEIAFRSITTDINHENLIIDPPAGFTLEPNDKKGSIAYTYTFNTYYDFAANSKLSPYIGVGLGYIYLNSDLASRPVSSGQSSTTVFFPNQFSSGGLIYQGIFGFLYHVTTHWNLYLDYRYLGSFNLSSAAARGDNLLNRIETYYPKYNANLVTLGITYKF